MNILLIYPQFQDTFWSFKHALKFINKKSAFPPLGLLTVAAMLPARWKKRVVDLNAAGLMGEDLAWADCVFISAMIAQRESSHQIISQCKKAGLRVVAGGPLFLSEYEEFEGVDHFVLNEAELTLPPFLEDLEKGVPKHVYRTSKFCNIRETLPPMWNLIDLEHYAAMCIQFSRGCPFNCEFCNVTTMLGHKPRIKTSDQVLSELDGLYNLGWRGPVFFVDDNFIGNKRYLKTHLLPALIQWQKIRRDIPFNTEASLDLADDVALMEMMVKAGFDAVFVGIETPDEGSLNECDKRQNKNRDLIESIKHIQRAGLQVQGGFIVGFDNDKRDIFHRQLDFIQKSGIVTAMVGLLNALPGTRLYARMEKEGRLSGHTSGDNVDGTTNIIPRMGLEVLLEGYGNLIRYLYSPKNYYERAKTFLREYKMPEIKGPLDFQHILAFFRSNIRLGIFGKERIQYWKILIWTFFHRPKLLPLAVTLAIYGYHYRKVYEIRIR